MIIPFPESSLNEEAGKLFMENYNEYFKIAKIFTQVYAKFQDNNSTSNNSCNSFNNQFSQQSNGDCYIMDSESNMIYGYPSQVDFNSNNISVTNTNFNPNTNLLKNKSLSDEINYDPDYDTSNKQILNGKGQYDFSLLTRNPSKSVSIKYPQQLIRGNNSINLPPNRKHSNLNNGDNFGNFLVDKPNINSLPFILRSNSFCNNENVNLVQSQNSNNSNMNHQYQTPTRSKKDEIKKWLSRI